MNQTTTETPSALPPGPTPPNAPANLPRPISRKPKVIARLDARRGAILAIYGRNPYATVREVIRHLNEAGIKATLGSTHRDRVFLGLTK
jgi:hypothetical protein